MAGTYGLYRLQALPGVVPWEELQANEEFRKFTATGVKELWRWLRSEGWR